MTTLYLLRLCDNRGRWWILTDKGEPARMVSGKCSQSKSQVLKTWEEKYGEKIVPTKFKIIRYEPMRPSEAAMELASL